MLNLKKPIVFFDLETTGLNVSQDRIIEASFLKVLPNGEKELKNYRLNPEMQISPASVAVHGITNEDVKDQPTFKHVAGEISQFIDGCDLAGYNCNRFDIPVLTEEFYRAEKPLKLENRNVVDVQKIYHAMEPRNLEAAYRFYCDKALENAHSAEADTLATFEILKAQLEKYEDKLKNNIAFLNEFCKDGEFVDVGRRMVYDEQGREVFNFGKHKGKLVEKVLDEEPQYYDWIMKSDFHGHTKHKLTEIKLRQRLQ